VAGVSRCRSSFNQLLAAVFIPYPPPSPPLGVPFPPQGFMDPREPSLEMVTVLATGAVAQALRGPPDQEALLERMAHGAAQSRVHTVDITSVNSSEGILVELDGLIFGPFQRIRVAATDPPSHPTPIKTEPCSHIAGGCIDVPIVNTAAPPPCVGSLDAASCAGGKLGPGLALPVMSFFPRIM
jgi:hypothetical protein